jgi:hypothetical protein
MLQRDGPYWRVVVQHEDTVFTRFVSPHWNEVLNPNSYLGYVGERLRTVIGKRCDEVADWYRDGRGQPLDAAWFATRQRELSTFHGEPYGHELPAEQAVSVATLCPAALGNTLSGGDASLWWGAALPAAQADALGRNSVWWAAASGHHAEVERLAALGAALDQPDLDGETPLHAAARQGHVHVVRVLLARGVDANRETRQSLSPLLLAVAGGHGELSAVLLQAGADANAQDRFGRTALYEAAQRGDPVLTALLLRHGADATLASRHGTDALQVARRVGHGELLTTLRASAPVVRKLGAAGGQALASSLAEALPGVDPQTVPQR